MITYILRRTLQAIPQLFVISLILFWLIMNTGDPLATMGGRKPTSAADKARLRAKLGLDKPWFVQYFYWLVGDDWVQVDLDEAGQPEYGDRHGVLRGDLGKSLSNKQLVIKRIADTVPNTLLLTGTAEIVIISVSLVIGIYAALRQYSLLDNFLTTLSFVGFSMPVFLIALSLMYIFAVYFKRLGLPYLPTIGMYDPEIGATPLEYAKHLVLPVTTISIISIATYNRYVRSAMLEVIGADYIRTARAKGLRDQAILFGHALKNAALPLVTLVGLDLPFLLAGAVVTERIFAWPGTGRLFLDSMGRTDTPVLMGLLMLISVAVVVFQLLTDIAYVFLDPRIRLE